MFPYADDTPTFSTPIWVFILVGLNVLFFVLSFSGGFGSYVETIYSYGTIPARFFQSADNNLDYASEIPDGIQDIDFDTDDFAAPFITLFTAIFLHGGLFHLLGNMWFLWLFGDNVEDRFGKLVFPFFYIICGLVAGLIHVILNSDSTVPAIGASGAIAGVMGAYIYMFPAGRIATLWGYYFYWTTIHIYASIYLGFWFIFQLLGGLVSGGASNVAFFAHVGGFVAGLVLAWLLQMSGKIKWYPGDRGYAGRPPIRSQAYAPRYKKRRYVWHD